MTLFVMIVISQIRKLTIIVMMLSKEGVHYLLILILVGDLIRILEGKHHLGYHMGATEPRHVQLSIQDRIVRFLSLVGRQLQLTRKEHLLCQEHWIAWEVPHYLTWTQ